MAVPKSKISNARRGQRRSHDALKKVNHKECNNCGELTLSHQVCASCGHYGQREVIQRPEQD